MAPFQDIKSCNPPNFSTKDEPAYTIYPDSNKIGIWTGRREEHVLTRMGENLDYYDGEVS